jgi:hypothetical protein
MANDIKHALQVGNRSALAPQIHKAGNATHSLKPLNSSEFHSSNIGTLASKRLIGT